MIQLARVGFAFVTQDVHLSGLDDRGRQALEPFIRRLQGRGIDILPLSRVSRVAVPEPLHHVSGQKMAFSEFLVRGGVEGAVGYRPQEELAPEGGPTPALGRN